MITGATGFLGAEIVTHARAAGWRVRALVRNPQPQARLVETLVGDLDDSVALRRACEGASAVVHAAGLAHVVGARARDFASFNLVNEVGTDKVVSAALEAGVPHIVLISSVSVYGSHGGAQCDETAPCNPQGPYATSKWRGELIAAERAKGRASLTILRFATIYGEGDRGNVARLIGAIDRGHFIWPGSGLNRKCLIFKEDAARACLKALECPSPGTEIFNVSAEPATVKEIVSAICQALGRPVPGLRIPPVLLNVADAVSRTLGDPGQISHRIQKFVRDDVYSRSKFENIYHFCPKVTLSEGLQREVRFLRRGEICGPVTLSL